MKTTWRPSAAREGWLPETPLLFVRLTEIRPAFQVDIAKLDHAASSGFLVVLHIQARAAVDPLPADQV